MTSSRSVSFSAYGTAAVTLSGDDGLMAELTTLWSRFLTAPDAPAGPVAIPVPDLATGSAEINRALVARTPYPAVHAGVVAVDSGAIALPAVSGAGKSTLTTALCLRGASYLSDEALVVDDTTGGRPLALPYPKPVALSPWSAAALGVDGGPAPPGDLLDDGTRELMLVPERLGRVSEAVPVAHVVLPERASGPPRLESVHRMEGVAALVRLSFNHHLAPRRFLLAAAAVVTGAKVWRLRVGEPVETARLVLDALG